MKRRPPLHDISTTLACARVLAEGRDCGRPAEWHVSWYDEEKRAVRWENSLACDEHKADAESRWAMGWRHRATPVCAMPGSLLHIAEEGVDEAGFPTTYCVHPFQLDAVVEEASHAVFDDLWAEHGPAILAAQLAAVEAEADVLEAMGGPA